MTNKKDNTQAAPPTGTTRHYYVFTDNGDFMEMGRPEGDTGPSHNVWFMAVDVEKDEDLYERAEQGEGTVLARASMDGAEVVLDIAPTAPGNPGEAQALSVRHVLGERGALDDVQHLL